MRWWKPIAGAAVAAGVAAVAVVALQQRAIAPGVQSASPAVAQTARLVQSREAISYTVPVAAQPLAVVPAARLTSYVFAHSKYSVGSRTGQSVVGIAERRSSSDLRTRGRRAPGGVYRGPDARRAIRDARCADPSMTRKKFRARANWLIPCAAAGVLSLALGQRSSAADDARAWLEKMNQALATRNYDGTFFHLSEGRVETMRIVHRVQVGPRDRAAAVPGRVGTRVRAQQ